MSRLLIAPKYKPQARTQETKAKILDAAQSAFAEQGFENTQLDQVAARAGCSRGAIYAHYANKEDLFLALMEHRVYSKFSSLCKQIADEPDLGKRPDLFRRWVLNQISDSSWGTLTLEYKLYAVRRPEPESRQRLLQLYNSLFRNSAQDFVELLFGEGLSPAARADMERRLAVIGNVLGGLILESHFQPALLPVHHLQKLAEELFTALIHA